MPSPDYVAEKCWQAVESLDSERGDQRDRVWNAVEKLIRLQTDDFPDAAGRAQWGSVREMMERHDAVGEEGTMRATLDGLSDAEVERIEQEIRELAARYPFEVDA